MEAPIEFDFWTHLLRTSFPIRRDDGERNRRRVRPTWKLSPRQLTCARSTPLPSRPDGSGEPTYGTILTPRSQTGVWERGEEATRRLPPFAIGSPPASAVSDSGAQPCRFYRLVTAARPILRGHSGATS